jgi:hypothetical protein
VQEEKAESNDDISREQYGSIRDDHNAACQGDRHHNQNAARQGKEVRDDNSYCSHERQTNKWLTWRIQEFHPSAFRLSCLGKASRNLSRLHSNEKPAERRRTPKRKRFTLASQNGHVVEGGQCSAALTRRKAITLVAGFRISALAPEAQDERCVSTRL